MEPLHLIVGLGNPGAEYSDTRHNAGFMLVEKLAAHWKFEWVAERKFKARMAKGEVGGKRVWLCEPLTFMNLSGESVGALVGFYQIPLANLLVIVDDADLPLGGIRMRPAGGAGGHHGLESVEMHLAAQEYARLRIGIGRRDGLRQITGHVLGCFGRDEGPVLDAVLNRAISQVECWLKNGIQKAMSQFNGTVSPNNEAK